MTVSSAVRVAQSTGDFEMFAIQSGAHIERWLLQLLREDSDAIYSLSWLDEH